MDESLKTLLLLAGAGLALYLLSRGSQANSSEEGTFPTTPPGGLTAAIGTAFNSVFPQSLSPAGAAFIQSQEGLELTAYADPPGQSNTFSIGYGHQINGGESAIIGESLGPGATITQAEAEALFEADVATAEAAVNANVSVPVTQGQFDALVDFVFNFGAGALERSTLLADLNAGDYAGAAEQFSQWANPQRRLADAQMFTQTDTATA